MDKKVFLGLLFCLGAVVLIIISVSMPWYQVRIDASTDVPFVGTVELRSEVDADFNHIKTETVTNGNRETEINDYDEMPNVKSVMKNTRAILILGLLILIVGILGVFLKMADKMDKNIVAILLVVGFVFILLAPVYLMLELPDAIGEDLDELDDVAIDKMSREFSGTDERRRDFLGFVTEVNTKWGGGPGWYLAFFAAGLAAIAALALFLSAPRAYSVPMGNSRPEPRMRVKRSAKEPENIPFDGKKTIIDEDEGMINY